MKYNNIFLALAFSTASLMTTTVSGQVQYEMSREEQHRKDSIEAVNADAAAVQQTNDKNRIADAKADRKETKAKAKAARNVERDASDAAQQSKQALRSERKAQKSRRQANDQADKASKAREKSDNN
jgi:hypothetical protein